MRKAVSTLLLTIFILKSFVVGYGFSLHTEVALAADPLCTATGANNYPPACTWNGKTYTLLGPGKNITDPYFYRAADGSLITVKGDAVSDADVRESTDTQAADASKKKGDDIRSKPPNCDPYVGFIPDISIGCIGYAFLTLFAWILGVAGFFLNKVVVWGVLDFGTTIKTFGTLDGFWMTIRDVANIVLIFSLLIIGISTILRVQQYGAKKLLANVVIAALLINFSFALTRVVIDASNYISTQFYTQLLAKGQTDQFLNSDVGLSGQFMQVLRMGSLYDLKNFTGSRAAALLSNGNSFLLSMLGCILFIILAYSFLIAALHIIGRIIVFLVLMVTSPLAVLARFLPFFGGLWNQWWGALWSNAIMLPAYFGLLWFVLGVMKNPAFQTAIGNGTFADLADGSSAATAPGSIQLLINFAVVIGLSLLTLSVAKKIGNEGLNAINFTVKSIGKYGGGFLARNAIGRPIANLDQRLAQSRLIGGTQLGSLARKYTTGLIAGAKFGTTKSGVAIKEEVKKEKLGRAAVRREADFRDDIERAIEISENPTKYTDAQKQEAEAKGLRALGAMSDTQLASLGVKTLTKDWVAKNLTSSQYLSISDVKNDKYTDEMRDKVTTARHKELLENAARAAAAAIPGHLSAEDEELIKKFDKVNNKELELIITEKALAGQIDTLARTLSQDKYDEVMKSDKIAASIKAALGKQRGDFLKESLGHGAIGTFGTDIKKLRVDPKAMAKMALGLYDDSSTRATLLPELVPHLKQEALREMMKAGADVGAGNAIMQEVINRRNAGATDPAILALANFGNSQGGRLFHTLGRIP